MIRSLLILIFVLLAMGADAAFYDRYWKWRDCFNEIGRCYDAQSHAVMVEQAGMIWGSLAILFAVIGLIVFFRRR